MLTINQVIKVCEAGIEVQIKRPRKYPQDLWTGMFLPDYDLIWLYPQNIQCKEEWEIALVHELLHARNEVIDYFRRKLPNEKDLYVKEDFKVKRKPQFVQRRHVKRENEIEREAFETMQKHPKVLTLIYELFEIRVPKRFR